MKIVVYSCATESYVPAWEPDSPEGIDIDWILFTNNSTNAANGWKTVELSSSRELDIYRSTRLPKAMPHRFLEGYELSVYIDSNVKPKPSWLSKIPDLIGTKTIGVFSRGYDLKREFSKVGERRYEDRLTLERQYAAYKGLSGSVLSKEVFWGGVIVRRHLNEECIRFGERWWENILRFSRRDQLSMPVALEEIRQSQVISWPERFDEVLEILPKPAKSIEYLLGEPNESWAPRSKLSRESYLELETVALRRLLKSKLMKRILEKQ